ncbi:hypothetical protein [Actinoallomurus rhizosphaericola]|uniref:hypothetical protein n=1 Tax=Actinoallomurus rhizosphaericola TaxID=2952536 RepID=UPI0020905887|nr:hypothetical protein [Actinoallomurus rhizosphaericola]MCO5994191.1 hypothetical protein [Actinoallomurus rhizosphaericola]
MTERDLPDRGQPANPEEVVHPDPLPDETPGIEEPEADFIEQRLDTGREEGASERPPVEELPADANEADVIEQHITAGDELDEDYS